MNEKPTEPRPDRPQAAPQPRAATPTGEATTGPAGGSPKTPSRKAAAGPADQPVTELAAESAKQPAPATATAAEVGKKGRLRPWVLVGLLCSISLLGILAVVLLTDPWAMAGQSMTTGRIRTLIAARTVMMKDLTKPWSKPKAVLEPPITFATLREQIALSPRETVLPATAARGEIHVFTWPSLIRTFRLRVRAARDGTVLAVDTASVMEDDFTDTLLTQNAQLPQQTASSATPVAGTQPANQPPVPVAPVPPPPAAGVPVEAPVGPLLSLVEGAFSNLSAPPSPGVFVFPSANHNGDTHVVGPAVAIVASYLLAETGRPLFSHDPWFNTEALRSHGLLTHYRPMGEKERGLVLADVNDRRVVRSVLKEDGKELVLTVQFESQLPGEQPASFEHRVPEGQMHLLPVLMARDVIKHLRIPWTEQDDAMLTASTLESPTHLKVFQDSLGDLSNPTWDARRWIGFDNSCLCLALCEIWPGGNGRFDPKKQRAVPLNVALNTLNLTTPVGFSQALKQASWRQRQTRYYRSLCRAAKLMKDEKLVDALLERWSKQDRSTIGLTERADFLINWAWEARGSGWALEVDDKDWAPFNDRIKFARRELEEAVKDPFAWRAHCLMLTIGMAQSEGYEWMHTHFEAATKLLPDNTDPYTRLQNALQKRWRADRASRLAFARECLDTGKWSLGIPQIGINTLIEETQESAISATHYAAAKSDDVWNLMTRFQKASESLEDENIRTDVLAWYCNYGIGAERYQEIAPFWDRLQAIKNRPSPTFRGLYYRDLMAVNRGAKPVDPLATARVALVECRDDAAAAALKKVTGKTADEKAEIRRLQKTLELVKLLREREALHITPEQLLEIGAEVTPSGYRPIAGKPEWSVEDNVLLWQPPVGMSNDPVETTLVIPFGLQKANVDGGLELYDLAKSSAELVLHAQGLRDPILIVYRDNTVKASRGKQFLPDMADTLDDPSIAFDMELRTMVDHVNPGSGMSCDFKVLDNNPSAFAIRLKTVPGFKCGINSLRIVTY